MTGDFLTEEIIEQLHSGDERCKYKIHQRIIKNTFQPGDHHKIGTKGTVIGSLLMPEMPIYGAVELYIINFDTDEANQLAIMVNIDDRILSVDEFQSSR